MTVVVTTNVAARMRGFLSSAMLELAPGVYTAPRMTKGVRERVWGVLEQWYDAEARGSVVMTWVDRNAVGGQGVAVLGTPPVALCEHDGVFLVRRGADIEL
jgi:CRISPR-associated protein Cas2